jgi:ribosomal protein S18 acetylase RimI-like enzyme
MFLRSSNCNHLGGRRRSFGRHGLALRRSIQLSFVLVLLDMHTTYNGMILQQGDYIDMADSYTTHVLHANLSHSQNLAVKSAALRLAGLLQSPDSFSSTYDEEVSLADAEKLEMLRRPKRITIIIAQTGDKNIDWTQAQWAGQVTLLGPYTRAEYLAPYLETHKDGRGLSLTELNAIFDPITLDDSSAVYWHMTALYVLKDHRRRGLGDQLCKKAFEVIQEHRSDAGSELRIVIKPGNGIVARMYERLGFETRKGRSTLAEAIVASEGPAALPVDYTLKEAFFERNGLIMVKRQCVE